MKNKIKLFTAALIMSILFTSCEKGFLGIRGEGPVVTQEFSAASFDQVDLAGAFDVVVSQSDTQSLVVQGQQNIIDRLDMSVSPSGKLRVKFVRGTYRDYDLTVFITVPDIEDVDLSGSGTIKVEKFNKLDNLHLSISGSGEIISIDTSNINSLSFDITGSGDINFAATSQNVYCDICGSGSVILSGSTVSQNLSISGSGEYDTERMTSQNTTIDISGSGDCVVNATSLLKVSISGSGDVYYTGTPSVDSGISGSGNIIKL